MAACAPTDPMGDDDDDDVADAAAPGQPDAKPPGPGTPDASTPVTPGDGEPGSACSCDDDCAADGTHAGICVYGICMTQASGACSAAGSTGECGAGSRCWGLEGQDGYICWPDCDAHDCEGTCDGDGSCAPTAETNCSPSCGSYCSCETADQCGDGETCVGGDCVPEPMTGDGPGPGPGPTCTGLPARDCTGTASYCGALVSFDPRTTAHYDDYPINGETAGNQYRSYLRRDLKMLLDHATAKVLCKTADWEFGNGGALGFGDMSEANGAIPGTSIGSPGHPDNTHENGFDIDLAYYQAGTANNRLRPICNHISGGQDQYHCVGEATMLDLWRHALFLGYVFESSRTRVIGVDGKTGPMLDAAIAELCDLGWLSGLACNNPALGYEVTDQGYGWYYFHHHHSHISLKPWGTAAPQTQTIPCYAGSGTCQGIAKPNPHQQGVIH
jgi:hypothetical protein